MSQVDRFRMQHARERGALASSAKVLHGRGQRASLAVTRVFPVADAKLRGTWLDLSRMLLSVSRSEIKRLGRER